MFDDLKHFDFNIYTKNIQQKAFEAFYWILWFIFISDAYDKPSHLTFIFIIDNLLTLLFSLVMQSYGKCFKWGKKIEKKIIKKTLQLLSPAVMRKILRGS